MSQAQVAVSLFGRIRVVSGERVLDDRAFPSRKAKHVFELLALARGSAVSKERLIEQIWGERLPRNPNATLEHTVSILRATCFQDSLKPVIVTVNGSYRLDTSAVSVDLVRFDQLLRAATHASRRDALQLLTDAIALAHGEVLEDEPEAEWAMVVRHDYRRRVERAALEAARLALLDEDPKIALDLAERAQRLAVVPSEDAYHLQASALIRLGRRADALLLLREAEVALERELGTQLAPPTVALREALLTPQALTTRPTALRLKIEAFSLHRPLPFVGRTAEMDRIDEAFDRVAAGGSALVLFEGPTGIGKTRLLDEVGLRQSGVRVCRLSCTEPGRAMARFTASRLRRALRAVGDELEDATPARSGPDAATVLYEQLASMIERIGPTVVLIDDVQWVDEESLAIIDSLAGGGGGSSGVSGFGVVATRHSASTDGAGRQLRSAARIEILPLTEEDLVAVGFPGGHRVTGGIPIVLTASAESQRNDGLISTATVDALVDRTLEAGSLAHEVLVAVAVTARPMPVTEIAYVLGLGIELAGALVEQLARSWLVVRRDELVELADDVTHQVLLAVIGEDRARSIRATAGNLPGAGSAAPIGAG